MRRAARPLLYLGIAGVVLGLSKIHARYVADPPYSFHGSSRFAWTLAYIVLLALAAYGVGLPDLPRSARQALLSAMAAAAGGALAISLVQLVVGDALLPRFVVFGSALLLVPWFLFCAGFATDGGPPGGESRPRAGGQRLGQHLRAAPGDLPQRRAARPTGGGHQRGRRNAVGPR